MKKAFDIWEKALEVWQTSAYELNRLKDSIDRGIFERCVKVISECKGKVITTGVGTSGAAAKKIAHSLSCVERPSFYLNPCDAVHGALGSVQKDDIAVLISKGGNTKEIVNIIPALKEKKALIIGVTENEKSIIAEHSDLFLKVKVEREADKFNMLATTSTMVVAAVFDAVCIALMSYTGFSKEQFALIHPGGAVGERLIRKTKLRKH